MENMKLVLASQPEWQKQIDDPVARQMLGLKRFDGHKGRVGGRDDREWTAGTP